MKNEFRKCAEDLRANWPSWATRFFIITSAEIFFEPDVKADKKVSTTHFLDLKLRRACPAVSPGDWDNSPGEAADNSFKR